MSRILTASAVEPTVQQWREAARRTMWIQEAVRLNCPICAKVRRPPVPDSRPVRNTRPPGPSVVDGVPVGGWVAEVRRWEVTIRNLEEELYRRRRNRSVLDPIAPILADLNGAKLRLREAKKARRDHQLLQRRRYRTPSSTETP